MKNTCPHIFISKIGRGGGVRFSDSVVITRTHTTLTTMIYERDSK